MSAEPLPARRPQLTVIEGGRATMGRPSKARLALLEDAANEARIELAARRAEELAMSVALAPLIRRLEIVAQASGQQTLRAISAIAHLHARHARRWADDDDRAIAA